MKKAIFVLLCASFVFAMKGAEGVNLIRNGNFANGAGGTIAFWNLPTEGTRVIENVTDGKNAIEFCGSISQWGIAGMSPGKYLIRFQLQKDCKNVLGVRMFCRDNNKIEIKNSKDLSAYLEEGKILSTWTPCELTLTIPEDAKYFGLVFHSHNGLMRICDINLTKITTD